MKKFNYTYIIYLAIVAAVGGILFGYDTAVISGTTEIVKNQFQLSDMKEGWYVGYAIKGSIIGVLAAESLSDYLGRKLTTLISAVFFTVSAVGCTFVAPLFCLIIFTIPESPKWLLSKKKDTKVMKVLRKIYIDKKDVEARMVETNDCIKDESKSHGRPAQVRHDSSSSDRKSHRHTQTVHERQRRPLLWTKDLRTGRIR